MLEGAFEEARTKAQRHEEGKVCELSARERDRFGTCLQTAGQDLSCLRGIFDALGGSYSVSRSKKRREKPDVGKLLKRLAGEEEEFLRREFLAPALRGGTIRVRIGGALCRIRIEPADFEGWGVFQPLSHSEAILAREATLAGRRQYLELFPLVRLIICNRRAGGWFGSAANFGDSRIRIDGLAPVHLCEEVQLFDCVKTRYDGTRFWFDEHEMRHDPAAAAYLREEFQNRRPPEQLGRNGLTAEQRAAYELSYWQAMRPVRQPEPVEQPQEFPSQEPAIDNAERVLRENLSHAGAQLVDYLERADSFRVTFTVGRQRYTSSVNKDDLTVQVAGICLSGEDQKFDLSSLVGVLREGSQVGELVPVGEDNEGMDEQEYWQIHPRAN